jgi:hypothetical protein
MGVRRSWLVLAVLLIPAGARPSDHKFSVYTALSRANNPDSNSGTGSVWNGGLSARQVSSVGDGLGWHVSGEVALKTGKLKTKLSFIGEASGHFVGAKRKMDATQITVMVGPRWAFPPVLWKRAHSFVHFMGFGAIHRSGFAATDSSGSRLRISTSAGAVALGAGFDAIPSADGHSGLRIQVDRIFAGTGVEDSWRYSAGYVYRFH